MIELVRSWLLGVTGVAIFTAMAESLMPEGAVKEVGKMTGGLVLLVAALTPILSLDLEEMLPVSQWEEVTITQTLEEERKNQWEAIIVEDLAAYIVDKAAAEGILCTAQVTCRPEGEIYLPETVTITGTFTPQQQTLLCQLVEEDLQVEQITFIEEGEG